MIKRFKPLLLPVLSMLICATVFSVSYNIALSDAKLHALENIKLRIALDFDSIGVEQPFFKNAGNEWQLKNYIEALNVKLKEQKSPVLVKQITAISKEAALRSDGLHVLEKPFGTIQIDLTNRNTFPWHGLPIAMLIGLGASLIWQRKQVKHRHRVEITALHSAEQPEKPLLIIDLYQKTMQLFDTGKKVALANKPLCFYLALLEYSTMNPDKILNANKDLPPEFQELADKYFHRLVALGHTIRKRPNFGNSLEKTLSEIRAALDEVFEELPDLKASYYPPKAHGEGSRSKLHSFNLQTFDADTVQIHGK
ncbi:hypothetical protein [Pseudoalteromonas xiamenensis]